MYCIKCGTTEEPLEKNSVGMYVCVDKDACIRRIKTCSYYCPFIKETDTYNCGLWDTTNRCCSILMFAEYLSRY